jgi:rare lipoprotein A
MQKNRLIAKAVLSACLASFWTLGHAEMASPKTGASAFHGIASYYHNRFHGRKTANGERFDQNGLTAMHQTLPFGTRLRVTNLANDRSVIVRVNDRSTPRNRRALDLTRRAAGELGFIHAGLARVRYEIIGPDRDMQAEKSAGEPRSRRTFGDGYAVFD